MKIRLSSPDGLGDFVLRMPMIEALLNAGHRLQAVMRPPASAFARNLFPEIDVHELAEDPFRKETKTLPHPFCADLRELEKFPADLHIVGGFQFNYFDQVFLKGAGALPPVAGLEAEEEFWPSDTSVDPRELAQGFSLRVKVPTVLPEIRKYELLARAVLGKDPEPFPFRQPSSLSQAGAERLMEEHHLKNKEFVVVCAGSRPGLVSKDWGENHWADLLRVIGPRESRTWVFFGNTKEEASIQRLIQALPAGSRAVNLAGNPPDVAISHALISRASAYLGRDSGVMHMAAAVDIPLLAVFSGGHWPRFLPPARRGIILTRSAPCRGCNFFCPYEETWCVKSVPVGEVASAWWRLPEMETLEIVELPAEAGLTRGLGTEETAAHAANQLMLARNHFPKRKKPGLWQRLLSRS